MTVAVLADNVQWEELVSTAVAIEWRRMSDGDAPWPEADAYLLLTYTTTPVIQQLHQPVLINAVTNTLTQLKLPLNVVRINGWSGFLQRDTWEVAGTITPALVALFAAMNKKLVPVADQPGLVAARTVAMIINEAYFALGENVSTKADIDTAMQLGTNYPHGPFAWAQQIGLNKILGLLQALGQDDKRYVPAPMLIKEAEI